jgi:hypothetical protein
MLGIDTLIQVNLNKLKDLSYSQLSTSGCKASSLETLQIETLDIQLSHMDMVMRDGAVTVNLTQGITQLLDYLTRQEVLDSQNADWAKEIDLAEPTCLNGGVNPLVVDPVTGQTTSSSDMDWKWQLFILCVASVTCLAGLLMAYHHWGKLTPSCLEDEDDQETLTLTLTPQPQTLWTRWGCSDTLLFHHDIPLWIRLAIPIAIISNIGLFIDSNIEPDAVSVMVAINTPSTIYDLGPVFNFGLGGTIKDMWEAEVYTLAVLIAFFSGAWPYIKLSSMLVAWLCPPGLLTVKSRENILIVLDALGKWSLVDFFVMVLMLCAFYLICLSYQVWRW